MSAKLSGCRAFIRHLLRSDDKFTAPSVSNELLMMTVMIMMRLRIMPTMMMKMVAMITLTTIVMVLLMVMNTVPPFKSFNYWRSCFLVVFGTPSMNFIINVNH